MKLKILPFITCIAIWITGCDKGKSPFDSDNTELSVIMPIEAGNTWTFIDSLFSSDNPSVTTVQLSITEKSKIFLKEESLDVYNWRFRDTSSITSKEYDFLVRNEVDLKESGWNHYTLVSPAKGV